MRVATALLQSGFFRGGRILCALEQLDRMTRHDRRYGVLVDELRVAVPTQQHAEIIEPGHDALELHAVHQKYREWNFALADVIEKRVLEILCALGCHCRWSVIASRTPAAKCCSQAAGVIECGRSGLGQRH